MDIETTALQGRTGLDRRLSPRQPVDGVGVDVIYERALRFGRRKLERVRMQAVDVSIEGALLLGPERDELHAGALVRLEAGSRAVAEIRHVSPRNDQALYGIRLIEMEPAFREQLFATVGRNRESLEDAWLHAR